jgi:POT family proton-dependent oligopeptide transporter
MSFWNLAVTVGNLWVLLMNTAMQGGALDRVSASVGMGTTAFQMIFFAVFAFVAAALFGAYAARYPVADHYRSGPA